jgi:hypothetical protein
MFIELWQQGQSNGYCWSAVIRQLRLSADFLDAPLTSSRKGAPRFITSVADIELTLTVEMQTDT